ncbi:efflux transporter outer membrane subunit [Methylomonas sp. MO1]|uniref:efflux transporter outer membrane subunit n=1 Tax=Methylomonas sp. MO1 TaxID=3073619 RepID=UPI0028A3DEE5|nr:efflux transporter outer membrane subunit [Methylomonas sp. MO1]MDT4288385.1 efflux transporter outer membrane subunit [Methylomonas sp. MO1]
MPHKPAWIIILIAAGGCTVGPDYREPTADVPVSWQAESSNLAITTSDPKPLQNWWLRFNDVPLNALMAKALAGNLDLKIALTRIDQARAERRGTQAELFPTVNIKAGAQRQDNPLPALAPGLRYNMFELGFDALWEIDLFGRQQRRLEAALAELDGANAAYRQALVTLSAELARGYVEYRSTQNQLRITTSNLQTQQATLSLTEKLFNEGVVARHEVVRARALTETTMAQIPALQAKLTGLLRQLELLIGAHPGTLALELSQLGSVPQAAGIDLLTSPAATLRNRPDLQIAERKLAAATALKGAAVAELFPKISLSAFLGLRSTDLESLFKSAAFSYGTAANLLQPLLNFGRVRAGIDLADARQQEAFLTYEKTVLEALRETETVLSRYLNEEQRRQLLASSTLDLRESLRLSQLRYQEGVISFLDVLDSQRSLYAAEIELARSEADTSTHLIAVYKALGGGPDISTVQSQLSEDQ